MADLCAKTELPVATCAHCLGMDDGPPEREPDSRPFRARYDGECAGCGFDVRPGERVRYADGGRLYHVGHDDG